jgi:hypothetical protein
MILGLNTDVRHRGKTFHIQTEDSGPSNPVLITHLFISGTIIATEKQGYDALVTDGVADEARVRERMRRQHKVMYEGLMAGTHDEAARRPRRPSRSRFKDIPLARRTGNVGLVPMEHTRTTSAPPQPPATPEVAEVLELPMPPLPGSPTGPTIPAKPAHFIDAPDDEPSDELSMLESVDLILLDDETSVLEYPTDLSTARPFDSLLVAHLLDDRA